MKRKELSFASSHGCNGLAANNYQQSKPQAEKGLRFLRSHDKLNATNLKFLWRETIEEHPEAVKGLV